VEERKDEVVGKQLTTCIRTLFSSGEQKSSKSQPWPTSGSMMMSTTYKMDPNMR